MPKIEVKKERFYRLLGRTYDRDTLEEILTFAKGELDDVDEEAGILKLELNDTNRPDLWSTAGLARFLRILETGQIPRYSFFSRPEKPHTGADSGTGRRDGFAARTVVVDPALKDIRPYIAAFAVQGPPVDEDTLEDLIQSQEKLCGNYGRKRKSIAMGIYRSSLIQYPIHYEAVDPEQTKFQPLGFDRVMSLLEINQEHPKGQEYGHIVAGFPKFPFLRDHQGEVLSFPPVINSATIGAVEPGDTELFVEMTGTDMDSLLLTASIMACDFADLGYTILPVEVQYPYDTPYGRKVVCPFYFQKPQRVNVDAIEKLLGESFSPEQLRTALTRMGNQAEIRSSAGDGPVQEAEVILYPPEYRNDFLHGVDIIEDVMIGVGMDHFKPVTPTDFTVGRLTDMEIFARKVVVLMVGLGFQEMIFNYLGSRKDFIEKMRISGEDLIQIANPMSENYEFVRNSILPSLLQAESVSANAAYPHHIFEVGKVARKDPSDVYGSKTYNHLGFLSAQADAGFNLVSAQLGALLYYLNVEYTLEEVEDPRFIPGRVARVMVRGVPAGVIGELAPEVLENWGIEMPCTAGELCLDLLRQD
ncbi:MAG: phenylalanine--tRNA ligase subunit beta [Spirochaetales bacterium]